MIRHIEYDSYSWTENTGSSQTFHMYCLEVFMPVHMEHSGFTQFPRNEQLFIGYLPSLKT